MTIYRGWNAKIYKAGIEIGTVKEVRILIDHSLEPYFEAGNRTAAKIYEGPINVKGKMSKAWIDTNYLSLLETTGTLTDFTLACQVSNMTLYLYKCKFNKVTVNVPQDGILTEDYDFLATSFAID